MHEHDCIVFWRNRHWNVSLSRVKIQYECEIYCRTSNAVCRWLTISSLSSVIRVYPLHDVRIHYKLKRLEHTVDLDILKTCTRLTTTFFHEICMQMNN